MAASLHYAALWAKRRGRVIFSDFSCSRTRRIFSGGEPEGGMEKVWGLTGRARGLGRYAPSLR